MMIVPLTQGKSAVVDDGDFARVSEYSWQYSSRGRGYAKRTVRFGNKFKTVYLHHFILGIGGMIDHENGNGLDNQRHNLRPCERRQNNKNRRPNKGFSSKGVRPNRHGKWQACIGVDGKRIYIGTFPTAEEAMTAYDRAAIEFHGEYARPLKAVVCNDPESEVTE